MQYEWKNAVGGNVGYGQGQSQAHHTRHHDTLQIGSAGYHIKFLMNINNQHIQIYVGNIKGIIIGYEHRDALLEYIVYNVYGGSVCVFTFLMCVKNKITKAYANCQEV